MPSHRMERVNQLIKRELAKIIQLGLKDPRISMASVTRVQTSPDLHTADVYVSIMGDDEEKEQAFDALDKATGYLRHQLSREINMKYVPELVIRRDDSLVQGDKVLRIINELELEEE